MKLKPLNKFFIIISVLIVFTLACSKKEQGSIYGLLITTGVLKDFTTDVKVVVSGGNLKKAKTGYSDEAGYFEITNLPAGKEYVVTFFIEGYINFTKTGIEIKPSERTFLYVDVVSQGISSKKKEKSPLTKKQKKEIERLRSLGYIAYYRPARKKEDTGVTHYNTDLSYPGLNLYISGHAAAAYLMDMQGEILHKWAYRRYITPTSRNKKSKDENQPDMPWRHVHVYPNGDILAIYEGKGLIKLDKNSYLLWKNINQAHHDLDIADDGRIFVLTRIAHLNPKIHPEKWVLEDYISILSPDGKKIKNISLYECYKNSEYADVLKRMPKHGELFHTNTLEILDGKQAGKSQIFKKGNILISSRLMDNIAIVDIQKEKIVWSMIGNWKRQHQPTLLANGNMLLFDNFDTEDSSKVIEFNPLSGETNWIYRGKQNSPLFSAICGSCQRLPNGNTLITESDNGRVIEVTANGEIVWEFHSPYQGRNKNSKVAVIPELIRLEPQFFPWINFDEK